MKFSDEKGAESELLWEALPARNTPGIQISINLPEQNLGRHSPAPSWPLGALGINDADVKTQIWVVFFFLEQRPKKG